MSYITPIYQTRDEAVAYILAIPHTGFKANPNTGAVFNAAGVTWHNTGVPTLATYEAYSATIKSEEGANLDHYYRDVEHWHAGPHFLATPDHIIVLGDLQADGVHCSCTNHDHYGVETIGDYRLGSDDPNSPGGKAAISNAANVIAALCIRFGWDPHKAVGFHRDCPEDHHPCPGPLLTSEFAIESVVARIAEIKADPKFFPHTVEPTPVPEAVVNPSVPAVPTPTIPLTTWPTLESNPSFFAAGATVFNAFKGKSLNNVPISDAVACGFVANMEAESAFLLNAIGDKHTAFGPWQHHWTPRGAAILAATGIDVRKLAGYEDAVDAAYWELTHTLNHASEQIVGAQTAAQAGALICTLFEGAGAPEAAQRRALMAERWATFFAKNPDVLAANPAKATNYKGTRPTFITHATELPTSFPQSARPSSGYGDVSNHNAPPEATHTPKEHYVDPTDGSPSHVQVLSAMGGVTVTLVPTHVTEPTIETPNPTVVVVK